MVDVIFPEKVPIFLHAPIGQARHGSTEIIMICRFSTCKSLLFCQIHQNKLNRNGPFFFERKRGQKEL
jgi:hypothetical protein